MCPALPRYNPIADSKRRRPIRDVAVCNWADTSVRPYEPECGSSIEEVSMSTPIDRDPPELTTVQTGPVLRLTLARPGRRNALSRSLVRELHDVIAGVEAGGETRVIVIAGEGPGFCAGADIAEFQEAAADPGGTLALADAEGIADLLGAIVACPVPVVAKVHGAAVGGAVGLLCAADIVVAAADARFALSEARLGLVAAVISPYVVAALGPREAVARILRAAPFDAETARGIGLIHEIAPPDGLDAAVDAVVADLLLGAPGALTAIKRLPASLAGLDQTEARTVTTRLLAERLGSAEGQEGLAAFLQKRQAAWIPRAETHS